MSDVSDFKVSKWVAPSVAHDSSPHELLSEASMSRLRQVARKQGHAEGLAAGMQEGRELVETRIKLLDRLADHLAKPLEQLESDALEAMVELSLAVSQALIQRELTTDPSLVLEAVSAALEAAPDSVEKLRVSVNPNDLALVKQTYDELGHEAALSYRADSSITPGGAVVEAGASVIDAQLEVRVNTMLEALLKPAETGRS